MTARLTDKKSQISTKPQRKAWDLAEEFISKFPSANSKQILWIINYSKQFQQICNLNSSKPSNNYYMSQLYYSVTLYFAFMSFVWFLLKTAIISLNSINQLTYVMVKCGVLFEVRTEFLNNI
jgi:hypothetical protein